MDSPIYDMIIIGGGPAGYTAALYAARAGLSTLVLEKLSAGGQMALTDTVDNYPGFDEGIDGLTLGMQMQHGAERFGAKTEYAEVLSVDFSEPVKTLHTVSGDFRAKTVVIAAGASPRELGLAGERELIGKGVHYCAHCDGRFYRDKTVIVVGGGNSAAADALYLSRIVKTVLLVHRRDTLRATQIYHKPLMETKNIKFYWNSRVTKLLADARVTGAVIQNTKTGEQTELSCDGVFVSIGRKPESDFLKGAVALDEAGYIIADETTKTNLPGVFAVGDIRQKALRQIVTAVSDGATAVHFAGEYLAEQENEA